MTAQTLLDDPLLDSLNDAQRAAVSAPCDHILVLAGAGSGKTRVLVHRIAWLAAHEGISVDRILAVTFTNKAAAQMRGRIESMLNTPSQRLWVGTFHGIAHRLLRLHWQQAGLPQSFQVIDGDDQLRLVRRILKNMNLDEERWPAKQAMWFINAQKEEGLRPQQIKSEGDLFTETHKRVYQQYEEVCQTGGLVDFAEILLRSYELWETQPDILQHYQQRFIHILVDEFQDTNRIQYRWLKILAGASSKLMIVGDDDQSIYSWRGAKAEHIRRFTQDFPSAQTIRLEQNYRSTSVILDAANAVISNNAQRLGKNLWTQGKKGEPITVYAGFNDRDEAAFIVRQIQQWVNQGGERRETAILYRSNAQSRVLEEALLDANMPYRVYGGLRFFERAEIKDALAYLRLIANYHDDSAFDRIVNTPARGIGDATLNALREYAHTYSVSLWQAAQQVCEPLTLPGQTLPGQTQTQETPANQILPKQILPTRAANALQNFLTLILDITSVTQNMALAEQTQYMLEKSGLLTHYRQDRSEKGLARVENLEELVNATHQFTPEFKDAHAQPLTEFLSHVSLESGELEAAEFSDCVQLMTLHSAKGLEFPVVFLSGMEEGLFPHAMSAQKLQQLEEERRLCYVGMTRAMTKLFLTYAEARRLNGREMWQRPSRFIEEIPEEFITKASIKTKIQRPVYTGSRSTHASHNASHHVSHNTNYKASYPDNNANHNSDHEQLPRGRRVRHPHFGEGVILDAEGSGEHMRVQVRFASGVKWLVVNYAKLTVL